MGGSDDLSSLQVAIDTALSEVRALANGQDSLARELLEFQELMLGDTALLTQTKALITAGMAAGTAWQQVIDGFGLQHLQANALDRARLADLADFRDRVLRHLTGQGAPNIPPGSVVVAPDLGPSQFLECDWSQGGAIVLEAGSPTSHVAMLARARGIPMVVDIGALPTALTNLLVDGSGGFVQDIPPQYPRTAHLAATPISDDPAITRDGTPVTIHINLSHPSELEGLDPTRCDGVGLVRTELYLTPAQINDIDAQAQAYQQVVDWAQHRPVTIRTLDRGADKGGPPGSFLGLRGIRAALAERETLLRQLRALLRVRPCGAFRVMVPMVTIAEEMQQVRAVLEQAMLLEQMDTAPFCLGMMVEVPAAALRIGDFDADFFSIGTNDLVQYLMAAGRDSAAVAPLADAGHPVVLDVIALVVRQAAMRGKPVAVCGDMAAEPRYSPALLKAGVKTVSVPPRAIAALKAAIRAVDLGD